MKSIVCPVDFSDAANNAAEYAGRLSKDFGAKLTLLHIAEEQMQAAEMPAVEEELLKEKMEAYQKMIAEDFGVSCDYQIADFNSGIEDALSSAIEKGSFDLVVMGTGGTREISQFFLGTHTSGLVRKTTSPILIVPAGCSFQSLNKVVYASDYQTEDVEALSELIELTKQYNPEITILHVSDKETKQSHEIFTSFQDLFEAKLKNPDLRFSHLVNTNIARAIDEYMSGSNADLLVLLTHRYSWFEKLFHSSTVKDMSFVATYPILVSHAGRYAEGN